MFHLIPILQVMLSHEKEPRFPFLMYHKSRSHKFGIYSMIDAQTFIKFAAVYSFQQTFLLLSAQKVNCVSRFERGVSLCLFYTNREKRLSFCFGQGVVTTSACLIINKIAGSGKNSGQPVHIHPHLQKKLKAFFYISQYTQRRAKEWRR